MLFRSRAKSILRKLEENDVSKDMNSIMFDGLGKINKKQLSFFEDSSIDDYKRIINEIKDLNLETCTPMDTFVILKDIKDKVEKL